MSPSPFGQVGVGAGDVEGDGAYLGVDSFEGGYGFFVEIGVDEAVADPEQLGRAESPLVGSADEHGVFEGEFESSVDDIEAVVGAQGELADGCGSWLSIFDACR